jgi:hypothetical protein
MQTLMQRIKNLFSRKKVEYTPIRHDSIKVQDGNVIINNKPVKSAYKVTPTETSYKVTPRSSSQPRMNSFGCECHHDSHFDDMMSPNLLNPLNPLNPLSPLSPFNPMNQVQQEIVPEPETTAYGSDATAYGSESTCCASDDDTRRSSGWDCSSSDSSSYDSGSSYDSSSSCDSSCDSSSSCD